MKKVKDAAHKKKKKNVISRKRALSRTVSDGFISDHSSKTKLIPSSSIKRLPLN